jgi:hypothetical protein
MAKPRLVKLTPASSMASEVSDRKETANIMPDTAQNQVKRLPTHLSHYEDY